MGAGSYKLADMMESNWLTPKHYLLAGMLEQSSNALSS